MMYRYTAIIVAIAAIALGGCTANTIAVPVADTDNATVQGPVVFISIDGQTPDDSKQHEVSAGEHEISILYRSYAAQYRCTFVFTAVAGHGYEFVTRSNPDPITLYRMAKENWMFWTRHDPVAPRECIEVST